MQMTDKSAAHFTVVSADITPDKICDLLGIRCDSSIWKGTPNPSGEPKAHPLNIAIFRSQLSDSLPMEEHVQDILSRIVPLRANIKKLPRGCIPAIHFNYRMQRDGGWSFGRAVLATLAKLAVPCVFSLEARAMEPVRRRREKEQLQKRSVKEKR